MRVSVTRATPWQRGFWMDVVDAHVIQFGLGNRVLVMDHRGEKWKPAGVLLAAVLTFVSTRK